MAWEYLVARCEVVDYKWVLNEADLYEELDRLGADGWELVAVQLIHVPTQGGLKPGVYAESLPSLYIFKRPLEDDE